MNKKELINEIAKNCGTTKRYAGELYDSVFDNVKEEMKKDDVFISGFGKFKQKIAPARTARNPKTGEPVDVPERKVVKFRVANSLKNELESL